MKIREQVMLGEYSTFHIGGPARFFITVTTTEELAEALSFAAQDALPVYLLGGGSNTLFADDGFAGVVIHIALRGLFFEDKDNSELCVAAAGESWDVLVAQACARGVWGAENLSGIPGTVGGAVVQNIGAYGSAISEIVEWVEVLDTTTRVVRVLSSDACDFGYRESIFKKEDGKYVVIRVALRLTKNATPNLTYRDLAARFTGTSPTLAEVRDAIIAIRRDKFPDLAREGTAGSFFKNPILSTVDAALLQQQFPGMPVFSLPESGGVKIPLAWFLDYRNGVLDMRSIRVGGARLFEKQPLVIAAEKNTSASDVLSLAHAVQNEIKKNCNFTIEPEVKIIL